MKSIHRLLLVLALAALFATVLAVRGGRPAALEDGAVGDPTNTTAASADAPPTTTGAMPPTVERPGYVVTRPGAELSSTAGGAPEMSLAGGILFPILEEVAGGYRVYTTCNTEGWIPSDQVETGMVPVTDERRMETAVIVIDPGHGLPDLGAVGPTGLSETEANMAVSAYLVELLQRSNFVDWGTGAVIPGPDVPAVAAAVMTRSPSGPNSGDYQLGLTFRAQMANSTGADALVSIHHNSVPETTLDHPGAETFVSAHDPESQRLGGLIVDELRRGFARFDAQWTGSPGSGIVIRTSADGNDFYSLLERSESPAVIIEGAYISNPSEEALARTEAFQRAYASGVYRALVRFITTDDDPIPAPAPVVWNVDTGSPSMSSCEIPGP